MSRDQKLDTNEITDYCQLIDYFKSGITPIDQRLIGTEHEKFVFRTNRVGFPLMQFKDSFGIEEILKKLSDKFDWEPHYESEHLLSLTHEGKAISLEPAGQFELSGKPLRTLHETKDEVVEHLSQLATVAGGYAAFCSFGVNPFVTGGELPWIPRDRYRLMRQYMAKQGPLGHWMMQTTCTIQANLDYTSEEDATDMIHSAVLISPIVNAIFSNSPIVSNCITNYQSFRARIWTQTDDDRCGVPDFMYEDSFKFADYVNWALDVPMYFIRRQGRYLAADGQTFRSFLEDGFRLAPRIHATMGDFELHLSTLFPEVRLKKYIEVRSCDGGTAPNVVALPALWKGILYDLNARAKAKALVTSRGDIHRKHFLLAAKDGIHGSFEGNPMLEVASELVSIAKSGLDQIAHNEGLDKSESIYLDRIEERLLTPPPMSSADRLRKRFTDAKGARKPIVEHYDMTKRYK